jgi:hypothetical protein
LKFTKIEGGGIQKKILRRLFGTKRKKERKRKMKK